MSILDTAYASMNRVLIAVGSTDRIENEDSKARPAVDKLGKLKVEKLEKFAKDLEIQETAITGRIIQIQARVSRTQKTSAHLQAALLEPGVVDKPKNVQALEDVISDINTDITEANEAITRTKKVVVMINEFQKNVDDSFPAETPKPRCGITACRVATAITSVLVLAGAFAAGHYSK